MRVAESPMPRILSGASPSLQWSRNLRVAERTANLNAAVRDEIASMEPQLEGCGKLPGADRSYRRITLLQWSRNLRVAERSCRRARTGPNILLQWSRNLRVAESRRHDF